MPKSQIVINVSGGVVQDVFASKQLAACDDFQHCDLANGTVNRQACRFV